MSMVCLVAQAVTIKVGQSTTLTGPTPGSSTGAVWFWSTPSYHVSTSTATGKYNTVTGTSAGTVTLTCTVKWQTYNSTTKQYVYESANVKTQSYTVTVTESSSGSGDSGSTTPTSISLNSTSISLQVGGTRQLTATVSPSGVSQSVTWSVTSGSSYVTVSSSGLVTAKAAGTATVRATSTADNSVYKNCTVTVTEPTSSIVAGTWSGSTLTIDANATLSGYEVPYCNYYKYSTAQMLYTPTEIGKSGTINSIAFKVASSSSLSTSEVKVYLGHKSGTFSSSSNYVTSSNLTLVYDGTPTLGQTTGWETLTFNKGTFNYNGTDNLVVVVTRKSDSWNSSLKYYYYNTGSGYTLYRQNDSDTSYGDVTSTSNSYSTSTNRPAIRLTYGALSPTSISLNSTSVSLEVGDTKQLTATVLPSGASQSVTWSVVSGSSYVSVSSSGLVTAKAAGTATVRATSTVQSSVYKNCTVTVTAPTSIAIDATNFPDENFRNYLLSKSYGSDGVLTEDEINGVTTIELNNKQISSLKGIEYFTALTQLECYDNQLTTLDVSKNTALTELRCHNNQLTTLDVSKNTSLTLLVCLSNHINGVNMDNLIAGLPQNNTNSIHRFYVIDKSDSNEGNVCTKSQVAAAKAKGWTPYYADLDGENEGEYEGSDEGGSAENDAIEVNGLYYAFGKPNFSEINSELGVELFTGDEEIAIVLGAPEGKTYTGDIVIPSTITYNDKTYPVIGVTVGAFANTPITSVKLPTSLKLIGEAAFKRCTGLTEVVIPEGVAAIFDTAFAGCTNLENITLPSTLINLGMDAFSESEGSIRTITSYMTEPFGIDKWTFGTEDVSYTDNLDPAVYNNATLYVPQGTKNLYESTEGWNKFTNIIEMEPAELNDGDTFTANTVEGVEMTFKVISAVDKTCQVGTGSNQGNLAVPEGTTGKITIPQMVNDFTVTAIGDFAFSDGKGTSQMQVTEVVIPSSVTTIGRYSFWDIATLKTIIFPESMEYLSINESAFSRTGITSLVLPACLSSITIQNDAFSYCSSLKSVYFSNSLTTNIGLTSFRECENIETILSEITSPSPIDEWTFATNLSYDDYSYDNVVYNTATLYVPQGTKSLYESTKGWKLFTNIIEMEATAINATNFPDDNFRNYLLEQSYGSDGVLTEDEISRITYIVCNQRSISNLKGIEYFTALTYLNCSNNQLTALDVSMNTELNRIECYSNRINAENMDALISGLPVNTSTDCEIVVFNTSDSNEGNEFTKSHIAAVQAKGWLPEYYDGAECRLHTNSFEVDGLCYAIGSSDDIYGEFNGVVTTTNAEIAFVVSAAPSEKVYSGDIVIPSSITYQGKTYAVEGVATHVFENSNIISVTFPSTLKIIGEKAFAGCNGLREVVIPEGAAAICENAFAGCTNLKTVTLPRTLAIIEEGAFSGNEGSIIRVNSYIEDLFDISPWVFAANTFDDNGSGQPNLIVYNSATLYVPNGTKAKYEAAEGWKLFQNIVEMEDASEPDTDISEMDNVLYVENTEVTPGSQVVLSVKLKNTIKTIQSFGFNLYLPDGFSFVKDDNGKVVCGVSSERISDENEFLKKADIVDDGSLMVVATGLDATINGNDGEVYRVTIQADEDILPGTYPLLLKKVTVTDVNVDPANYNCIKSSLIVPEYMLGDADGSRALDVSDLTTVVNYMFKHYDRLPKKFNFKAADVAKPVGELDVSDLTGIVNLMFYGTINRPQKAKATNNKNNNEPQ